MAGPALLEGGIAATKAAYGAILPHVPYYAMEGVSTFNEVKSMMEWAGWMLSEIENSTLMSFSVGFFDGVYKFLYNAPPDSPYLFSNPLFQFSSDLINGLLMFLKK